MPIERDIDVAVAVKLAGMPLDEFQTLNPQMNRPVILAAGTPQMLLPYDNANRFVRELPLHRGPLATWTAWIAPQDDEARPKRRTQVGMSEDELREVNRIPPRMLIKAGSTLLVPRGNALLADVSSDGRRQRHDGARARRRRRCARCRCAPASTTASPRVAKRYRVSAAQVAQWNDVGAGASFAPGQTIVVYVAAQGAARRRRRRTAAPRGRRTDARARAAAQGRKPQPATRAGKQRASRKHASRKRCARRAPRRAAARALSADRRSAWAMVPRSTYSSSLPIGTPRASRVTRRPRALAAPRRAHAPWPRPRR